MVKTCKSNALMSSSSKFRSLCVNMMLPWWNKWHSCHVDCRAGLAILAREHCRSMWRRGKVLLLPVAAECTIWTKLHKIIYIKEVNHVSMESNLWSLNIEMVLFILLRCLESNLCRIEMHNDLDDLNMQPPDCFVSLFLPENMQWWVFFDQFHEVWMFVLLPIL